MGDNTKWPTRVDVSINLHTINQYPKRDKQDSLSYWVDVQADLRLCWLHRSYCMFLRPVKTQISLRIRAVWSDSSQITRAFHSLQAIQRGISKNSCHAGVNVQANLSLAGSTGFIVGLLCAGSYMYNVDICRIYPVYPMYSNILIPFKY